MGQRRGADEPGADREAIQADLETVQEELRVADEQIHAQQAELRRLLRLQEEQSLLQERVLAALPAAVIVTDTVGLIVVANTAMSALLAVPGIQLPGKPFQAYIAQGDRRELRSALARLPGDRTEIISEVRLRPRRGGEVHAQLIGHPRTNDRGRVVDVLWVVLPNPSGEVGAVTVAEAFSRLVELPLNVDQPKAMLRQMAGACATSLGGDVSVTLTMGPPMAPDGVASTDTLAQTADGAMIAAGEGPGQDAWELRTPIESADLRTDDRWPRLAEQVKGLEVSSAFALPLQVADLVLGSMSLYSRAADRFDSETREIAQFLGTSIAAVLREVEQRREISSLAAHLERAMASRPVIEQAKGILMAAHGCTSDQAFAMLLRTSRETDTKLRDVAQRTVDGTASTPR